MEQDVEQVALVLVALGAVLVELALGVPDEVLVAPELDAPDEVLDALGVVQVAQDVDALEQGVVLDALDAVLDEQALGELDAVLDEQALGSPDEVLDALELDVGLEQECFHDEPAYGVAEMELQLQEHDHGWCYQYGPEAYCSQRISFQERLHCELRRRP